MRALVMVLASAGGAGYSPVAPGTCGALVAVPFLPLLASLRGRSPGPYGVVIGLVLMMAVWAAGRAEVVLGAHDHSRIVIDELAGLVVAGIFVPGTWLATGLAFAFFRLFDVLKPFPASVIDRRLGGGLGVVADDVVAGIYAGLATRLALGFL